MVIFIVISFILAVSCDRSSTAQMSKKVRCLNPPRTAKKVETFIKDCQEEVKNKIVKEAFELLRDELKKEPDDRAFYPTPLPDESDSDWNTHRRYKRSLLYHPTLVPSEDKRIAGVTGHFAYNSQCLLHCVYAKNNAIDKFGWPTLDGLVGFYSEGVNEHGFFMGTLRAVNLCLHAATQKYRVNRRRLPEKGESCDLAFDVFDCISDQITNYCFNHYRHE